MKATPESIFSLAARTATKIGSYDPEQAVIEEAIKNNGHPYWAAIEAVFNSAPALKTGSTSMETVEQPKETPPPLILTSVPFSDQWRSGVVKLYKDFMNVDVTAELEKFLWPSERRQDFN